MANIGRRPTLGGDAETRLETFIFDYSGDLYGSEIGVRLVHFLRPDAKFAGLEELKVAIAEDERQAGVPCREIRAHRAGERAFVGQRERRVTLASRTLDQLLRMRRAPQERKIRQAVKLGIGRQQVGRCHTA